MQAQYWNGRHHPRVGFSHDVLNGSSARARLTKARADAATYPPKNGTPRTWRDMRCKSHILGNAHGIGDAIARALSERRDYVSAPVQLVDGWRDTGDVMSLLTRSRDVGGWYADEAGDRTYTGHVWQLPARDGSPCYVAGYTESEETGYCVLEINARGLAIYDEPEEAARAANELARVEAERDRDADAEWQRAARVNDERDDARSDMKDARAVARIVVKGLRELAALPRAQFSNARATLLDELSEQRERMREAIRTIAAKTDELQDLNNGDFPA